MNHSRLSVHIADEDLEQLLRDEEEGLSSMVGYREAAEAAEADDDFVARTRLRIEELT
ncbi:MAG: hypothetical protein JXA30_20015 [Deltaproteobacteria bacterium]|nr:hypothetical protein [Deltaproteobacteria bacterium]